MIINVMNYAINYQQMIHQRHVFFMKISVLKHMLIAKIMILMLTKINVNQLSLKITLILNVNLKIINVLVNINHAMNLIHHY